MLEWLRLWLVCGTELRRLAPILPILVRPLTGGSEKIRHSTAGSIIFRFRPVENFWRFVNWLWSFVLILNVWVVLSWLVAAAPFLIPMLIGGDQRPVYLYIFYFLYLLPIVLPLTPVALAYDRTRFRAAARDLSKGMFAFIYYLLKWTIVLLLLMLATVLALQLILAVLSLTGLPFIGGGRVPWTDVAVFANVLIAITIFLVFVRPASWVVSALFSYRRDRKKQQIN